MPCQARDEARHDPDHGTVADQLMAARPMPASSTEQNEDKAEDNATAGAGPSPASHTAPAASHSDGPWKACHNGECRCGMIWDGTGNIHVATVHDADALGRSYYGSDSACTAEVRKANARLIAAAPDLLRELKFMANFIADDHDNAEEFGFYRDALAAIAKAEGR